MSTISTEPADPTTLHLSWQETTTPTCQALVQCADQCCDPVPCTRLAVARVTFRCASRDCDHAGDLLLLCERCTEQADILGVVLARRPL